MWMASQCDPDSVCRSVFTISVPELAIGYFERMSDAKTARNETTSLKQHIICRVNITRNP
jgi:hypothetical protein